MLSIMQVGVYNVYLRIYVRRSRKVGMPMEGGNI